MQAVRLTPWFRQSLSFFLRGRLSESSEHTQPLSASAVRFFAGSAAAPLPGPSTTGVKSALLVR